MALTTGFLHKKWYVLSILIMILTAFFSEGYHHPDEHFQILEFANYKLGLTKIQDLPWEFTAQCRSAVQPFLGYLVARLLQVVGLYNPFVLITLLRLCMGLLSWYVYISLYKRLQPTFVDRFGSKLFEFVLLFLWFIPYISVRFSAESLAAICFFGALLHILDVELYQKVANVKLVWAGFLLGILLFVRLQMGFAILGLGIWLIFIQKTKLKHIALLALGASLAIGTSVLIDHWFYNQWVFTPYNYFDVNIIKNVAAQFGVMPWWYYFKAFFDKGVPPICVIIMLFYVISLFKYYKNPMAIISVLFLLGHMAVGHKELRFLFPIAIAVLYMSCMGLDYVLSVYPKINKINLPLKVAFVVNTALIMFRTFTPANETIPYFRYIYHASNTPNTVLVCMQKSIYNDGHIESNFYKPKHLQVIVVQNLEEFDQLVAQNPEKKILYFSDHQHPEQQMQHHVFHRLYSLFPDWILANNINDWQSRSDIWGIYQVAIKH